MKSSGVGGGGAWVASTPQKVLICWKSWQKPWKSGKMVSNVVWLQKMTPKVCIKTHEDLFLEVTPKRGLHDLCGRKFVGKSSTKNFSRKFGEIQAKSCTHQNFACSYTYNENAPPPPLPLFWKGREGNALAMLPFTGVPVHIILHELSLLVAEGYGASLQWI